MKNRYIGSAAILALTCLISSTPALARKARGGGPQALIGNTVHATDMVDGEEYWSYFRPDGTGANAFANGDVNSFSWRIDGSTVCLTYSDGTECSRFNINGGGGVEIGISGNGAGRSSNFDLLRGNVRGL